MESRTKRTFEEVAASAAIAHCFKRFKGADVAPLAKATAARDHDNEMLDELEDGRSCGDSRRLILSQYWQIHTVTPITGGEPATHIKFTSRYKTLSTSYKLRLLEATHREEVAADLLANSFTTMPVGLQLELLRLSPYHKIEMGMHLLSTQFPVMTDDLRMRFLEVSPCQILIVLLERHFDWLSVREALTAARNLEDRQFADLRRSTCETVWKRKDQCDVDDLVRLAQIVLPKFGREIVNEIRTRCAANGSRTPIPKQIVAKPIPTSSLALLFPASMAQCFHVQGSVRQSLGHGPMVPIPEYDQGTAADRVAFRLEMVMDWASAEYGFLHVVLTRKLGDLVEAMIVMSDGSDRQIEVGVVDDDSPSLEIPWPMATLGTANRIVIDAHLRQASDHDETDVDEVSENLSVGDGGSAVLPSRPMDHAVRAMASEGVLSDIEQIKLLLAYRDPHVKSLLDMMIDKARNETSTDPNAFIHLFRQCRNAILSD